MTDVARDKQRQRPRLMLMECNSEMLSPHCNAATALLL